MKHSILILLLASNLWNQGSLLGQGYYLDAADGNPRRALAVDSEGNVGVGIAGPTARLQIQAPSRTPFPAIAAVASDSNAIRLFPSMQASAFNGIVQSGDAALIASGPTLGSGALVIAPWSVGTSGIRMTADGQVGIGTASPSQKLTVELSPLRNEGILARDSEGRFVMLSASFGAGAFNGIVREGDGGVAFSRDRADSTGAFVIAPWANAVSGLRITGEGNVGIGLASPEARLDVAGKVRCHVLELTSDRAAKGGVADVDGSMILHRLSRLPISSWHYTNAPAVRHMGPMAQDFHEAFGLGDSERHIGVSDGLGVAFAAIQALNWQLERELAERNDQVASLERSLEDLRSSMAANLAAIERRLAGTAPVPAQGRDSDDEVIARPPREGETR